MDVNDRRTIFDSRDRLLSRENVFSCARLRKPAAI